MAVHVARIEGTKQFIYILKTYHMYHPFLTVEDIMDGDPSVYLANLFSQEDLLAGYKTGHIPSRMNGDTK